MEKAQHKKRKRRSYWNRGWGNKKKGWQSNWRKSKKNKSKITKTYYQWEKEAFQRTTSMPFSQAPDNAWIAFIKEDKGDRRHKLYIVRGGSRDMIQAFKRRQDALDYAGEYLSTLNQSKPLTGATETLVMKVKDPAIKTLGVDWKDRRVRINLGKDKKDVDEDKS